MRRISGDFLKEGKAFVVKAFDYAAELDLRS